MGIVGEVADALVRAGHGKGRRQRGQARSTERHAWLHARMRAPASMLSRAASRSGEADEGTGRGPAVRVERKQNEADGGRWRGSATGPRMRNNGGRRRIEGERRRSVWVCGLCGVAAVPSGCGD